MNVFEWLLVFFFVGIIFDKIDHNLEVFPLVERIFSQMNCFFRCLTNFVTKFRWILYWFSIYESLIPNLILVSICFFSLFYKIIDLMTSSDIQSSVDLFLILKDLYLIWLLMTLCTVSVKSLHILSIVSLKSISFNYWIKEFSTNFMSTFFRLRVLIVFYWMSFFLGFELTLRLI